MEAQHGTSREAAAAVPYPGVDGHEGEMTPVDAYRSHILAAIRALPPVELDLADAEGCVLAEDVTAAVALPSFDNSSMDGYAVLAADTAGASEQAPVTLPVTGEIAAGDTGAFGLRPGTAMRIMTGAQLPAGADAVVPVELHRRRHRPGPDPPCGDARRLGPLRRRGCQAGRGPAVQRAPG